MLLYRILKIFINIVIYIVGAYGKNMIYWQNYRGNFVEIWGINNEYNCRGSAYVPALIKMYARTRKMDYFMVIKLKNCRGRFHICPIFEKPYTKNNHVIYLKLYW